MNDKAHALGQPPRNLKPHSGDLGVGLFLFLGRLSPRPDPPAGKCSLQDAEHRLITVHGGSVHHQRCCTPKVTRGAQGGGDFREANGQDRACEIGLNEAPAP